MTVFTCEDNFESMMTCIYDAWASGLGHENVCLKKEPVTQLDLFCEYVHVSADAHKVEMVVRSIQKKISVEVYQDVFYAALSNAADAPDIIYRFLILGFAYGRNVTAMLSYPESVRMMELKRNVENETHNFREFARFTLAEENVYICHFEPKNNVLIPVAGHFQDRMPSEHWMMIDDNRRVAAIHPANQEFYLRYLTAEEADVLQQTEQAEDKYVQLWKTFFHTIGIAQRENPDCQRNLFPIWMRKHATEFQDR